MRSTMRSVVFRLTVSGVALSTIHCASTDGTVADAGLGSGGSSGGRSGGTGGSSPAITGGAANGGTTGSTGGSGSSGGVASGGSAGSNGDGGARASGGEASDGAAGAGGGEATDGGPFTDPFGVRRIYGTIPGGREWYLPADAETPNAEWNVEDNPVTKVSPGVFHTLGNDGEVRLTVSSPSGKAWWRNVEMTAYFRYTAPHDSNGQARHWELLARTERHSGNSASGSSINRGVAAPAGTATWPGYPFGSGTVNVHCLGSSYHGNAYVDGHVLFEKEITHTEGYAPQRGSTQTPDLANPLNRWFGYKFVVRNADANRRVHLELWLDASADGTWRRVMQYDDSAGKWAADGNLDGCGSSPFAYSTDQLITWAGPWLIFRSDSIATDFRWLSAREVGPIE